MTVNTLMAIYTTMFGFTIMADLAAKYIPEQDYVMCIFGAVSLYGIVETVTKYYYIRKSVVEEIEAKGGDNE